MKQIFTIVLLCIAAITTAKGQDVELPSFEQSDSWQQNTPSAQLISQAKPKKQTKFDNEFAVSLFGNGLSIDSTSPFETRTWSAGTPYTRYNESLYVAGNIMTNCCLGLQYYRSCWEYFSFGVITGVSNWYQNLYQRTTGTVVDRYDRTDLLVAPVMKCNFIEGRYLRIYCSIGAVLNTSIVTLGGAENINCDLRAIYCIGWSLGRKVYFFEETGLFEDTVLLNMGLGIRF